MASFEEWVEQVSEREAAKAAKRAAEKEATAIAKQQRSKLSETAYKAWTIDKGFHERAFSLIEELSPVRARSPETWKSLGSVFAYIHIALAEKFDSINAKVSMNPHRTMEKLFLSFSRKYYSFDSVTISASVADKFTPGARMMFDSTDDGNYEIGGLIYITDCRTSDDKLRNSIFNSMVKKTWNECISNAESSLSTACGDPNSKGLPSSTVEEIRRKREEMALKRGLYRLSDIVASDKADVIAKQKAELDQKIETGKLGHRRWAERKDASRIRIPDEPLKEPSMRKFETGPYRPWLVGVRPNKSAPLSSDSATIVRRMGPSALIKYAHGTGEGLEDLQKARNALLKSGIVLLENFADPTTGEIDDDAREAYKHELETNEAYLARKNGPKERRIRAERFFQRWIKQKSAVERAREILAVLPSVLGELVPINLPSGSFNSTSDSAVLSGNTTKRLTLADMPKRSSASQSLSGGQFGMTTTFSLNSSSSTGSEASPAFDGLSPDGRQEGFTSKNDDLGRSTLGILAGLTVADVRGPNSSPDVRSKGGKKNSAASAVDVAPRPPLEEEYQLWKSVGYCLKVISASASGYALVQGAGGKELPSVKEELSGLPVPVAPADKPTSMTARISKLADSEEAARLLIRGNKHVNNATLLLDDWVKWSRPLFSLSECVQMWDTFQPPEPEVKETPDSKDARSANSDFSVNSDSDDSFSNNRRRRNSSDTESVRDTVKKTAATKQTPAWDDKDLETALRILLALSKEHRAAARFAKIAAAEKAPEKPFFERIADAEALPAYLHGTEGCLVRATAEMGLPDGLGVSFLGGTGIGSELVLRWGVGDNDHHLTMENARVGSRSATSQSGSSTSLEDDTAPIHTSAIVDEEAQYDFLQNTPTQAPYVIVLETCGIMGESSTTSLANNQWLQWNRVLLDPPQPSKLLAAPAGTHLVPLSAREQGLFPVPPPAGTPCPEWEDQTRPRGCVRIVGLMPNRRYGFRIRAFSRNGVSEISFASFTTAPLPAPAPLLPSLGLFAPNISNGNGNTDLAFQLLPSALRSTNALVVCWSSRADMRVNLLRLLRTFYTVLLNEEQDQREAAREVRRRRLREQKKKQQQQNSMYPYSSTRAEVEDDLPPVEDELVALLAGPANLYTAEVPTVKLLAQLGDEIGLRNWLSTCVAHPDFWPRIIEDNANVKDNVGIDESLEQKEPLRRESRYTASMNDERDSFDTPAPGRSRRGPRGSFNTSAQLEAERKEESFQTRLPGKVAMADTMPVSVFEALQLAQRPLLKWVDLLSLFAADSASEDLLSLLLNGLRPPAAIALNPKSVETGVTTSSVGLSATTKTTSATSIRKRSNSIAGTPSTAATQLQRRRSFSRFSTSDEQFAFKPEFLSEVAVAERIVRPESIENAELAASTRLNSSRGRRLSSSGLADSKNPYATYTSRPQSASRARPSSAGPASGRGDLSGTAGSERFRTITNNAVVPSPVTSDKVVPFSLNSSGISGNSAIYSLFQCTSLGPHGQEWKEVFTGTANTARIENLLPGTAYHFRLQVINSDGVVGAFGPSSVLTTALCAPQGFRIAVDPKAGKGMKGVTHSSIHVKWDEVSIGSALATSRALQGVSDAEGAEADVDDILKAILKRTKEQNSGHSSKKGDNHNAVVPLSEGDIGVGLDFHHAWAQYDPSNTGRITVAAFRGFLADLGVISEDTCFLYGNTMEGFDSTSGDSALLRARIVSRTHGSVRAASIARLHAEKEYEKEVRKSTKNKSSNLENLVNIDISPLGHTSQDSVASPDGEQQSPEELEDEANYEYTTLMEAPHCEDIVRLFSTAARAQAVNCEPVSENTDIIASGGATNNRYLAALEYLDPYFTGFVEAPAVRRWLLSLDLLERKAERQRLLAAGKGNTVKNLSMQGPEGVNVKEGALNDGTTDFVMVSKRYNPACTNNDLASIYGSVDTALTCTVEDLSSPVLYLLQVKSNDDSSLTTSSSAASVSPTSASNLRGSINLGGTSPVLSTTTNQWISVYLGSSTSFDIKGLSPNTVYSLRVSCLSRTSQSPYSSPLTVSTLPLSPLAPVPIRTEPRAAFIRWYPGSASAVRFEVQVKLLKSVLDSNGTFHTSGVINTLDGTRSVLFQEDSKSLLVRSTRNCSQLLERRVMGRYLPPPNANGSAATMNGDEVDEDARREWENDIIALRTSSDSLKWEEDGPLVPVLPSSSVPASATNEWRVLYQGPLAYAQLTGLFANSVYRVRVVSIGALGSRSMPSVETQIFTPGNSALSRLSLGPQNAHFAFSVQCAYLPVSESALSIRDIVVGDIVLFSEEVFVDGSAKSGSGKPFVSMNGMRPQVSASHPNATFVCTRTLVARVIGDSASKMSVSKGTTMATEGAVTSTDSGLRTIISAKNRKLIVDNSSAFSKTISQATLMVPKSIDLTRSLSNNNALNNGVIPAAGTMKNGSTPVFMSPFSYSNATEAVQARVLSLQVEWSTVTSPRAQAYAFTPGFVVKRSQQELNGIDVTRAEWEDKQGRWTVLEELQASFDTL